MRYFPDPTEKALRHRAEGSVSFRRTSTVSGKSKTTTESHVRHGSLTEPPFRSMLQARVLVAAAGSGPMNFLEGLPTTSNEAEGDQFQEDDIGLSGLSVDDEDQEVASPVTAPASAQVVPAQVVPAQVVPARVVPTRVVPAKVAQIRVASVTREHSKSGVPALSATVGTGSRNRRKDVRIVQERLVELGFLKTADGVFWHRTSRAIRIFRSIAMKRSNWTRLSDRVRPRSNTLKALFDNAAPRWVPIPKRGTGWIRSDREGYHWATQTALNVLNAAGVDYEFTRSARGGPHINVNDVSRFNGTVLTASDGTAEHDSHRNGLSIDILVPRRSDPRNLWVRYTSGTVYYREQMFSMLKSFAAQPEVTVIRFADRRLIRWAQKRDAVLASKLVYDSSHTTHAHIDISPG